MACFLKLDSVIHGRAESEAIAYWDDGRIVDEEYVLKGYCGNLCNEDSPKGICDCRVQIDEVELHILPLDPLNHHLQRG